MLALAWTHGAADRHSLLGWGAGNLESTLVSKAEEVVGGRALVPYWYRKMLVFVRLVVVQARAPVPIMSAQVS